MVGRLGHCAVSGDSNPKKTIRIAGVLICHLPSGIITKIFGRRPTGNWLKFIRNASHNPTKYIPA
jgi:hypothetical protein